MVEIYGVCPPQFDPVRDRFQAHFNDGLELGARFTVCQRGEVLIDLWGGSADLAEARPYGPDTLTTVFSTTKAIMALMIARLVDQGLITYDTPVAEVWPEFAAEGKGAVTLAQLMSHQAGLSGLTELAKPEDWLDPPALAARLAAQAPMWPLGEGSGYHPSTMSYLGGEVFRRVDGRTMGTALREDITGPLGLDFFIGLPEAEEPRLAEMKKPPAPPNLGVIDAIKRAAFIDRGGVAGTREWRAAELPGAGGVGTAEALAKLMSTIANEGCLDGLSLLSPDAIEQLTTERVRGADKVVPFTLGWAAGLMRNEGLNVFGPGARAVGHYGWGGSAAMADPETGISAAYVMNKQSPHLIGDPRPVALFNALYAAF